jgi:predicted enzyme related to lactoylglutathione lyase
MDAMTAFYSEAFDIHFTEVDTFGIQSRFGDFNGITLKFVPIRDEADFENYPIHQLGFDVRDIQKVIEIALKHGGKGEGELIHNEGKVQAAVRDPDGNTIELYSEE